MFRRIGDYELTTEGNLLVLRCSAVWNTETTLEYTQTVGLMVASLESPWGVLAIVQGVPVFGPEGEALMQDSVRRRFQIGMRALALIIQHGDGESICRAQMQRIYVAAGVKLAYFDEEAAARQWLADVLADS
ncbi:MAG: hypothetical protein ACT4NL_00305 [Pseudomarimonas sp.]